jgi:hypothetical protein
LNQDNAVPVEQKKGNAVPVTHLKRPNSGFAVPVTHLKHAMLCRWSIRKKEFLHDNEGFAGANGKQVHTNLYD